MASPRLQSSWVWNKNPETNHWKSYQQQAISALGVQASISDDGLTAFSEVHILPVHGGLPLLLPAHHVGIASNLPLRLALVRDHIPADDKEEKCPKGLIRRESHPGSLKRYYLEETAGEERILKGPKLPVVFLWRELVADSIQDCWLLQRHVWIQCRAGGDERFEGVGKCTNQVRGEGVPKHVRYLNISNDCILATRCYSYQDLGGSCHASSGRDHNVESHVAHNRPVGVQQQSW